MAESRILPAAPESGAEKLDAGNPEFLRGDPITGDRYYSPEFARLEWEHMWTKVWHIAGRETELPEAGDWIVHNFLRESVIAVRQTDGKVRAFYNTCQHRGNRLVWASEGHGNFTCSYHGLGVRSGRRAGACPGPGRLRRRHAVRSRLPGRGPVRHVGRVRLVHHGSGSRRKRHGRRLGY